MESENTKSRRKEVENEVDKVEEKNFWIMQELDNIKNIVFDLGGVLIDLEPERTLRAFAELKKYSQTKDTNSLATKEEEKSPISINDLVGGGESEWMQKYQVGEMTTEEFFSHVASGYHPSITKKQLEEAWCAMLLSLPKNRLEMLKRLREAGYQVLILSNTNEAHTAWVHRHFEEIGLKIGEHVDCVYYSNEIGLAKPDHACYEYVIQDANIRPNETLYIDDLEKNVKAGQLAGWTSIQAIGDEWIEMAKRMVERKEG